MFGFEHNFVREINPELTRNTAVCCALLFWVGLQAVVLHLQGRWGARFMIPARCGLFCCCVFCFFFSNEIPNLFVCAVIDFVASTLL
jgi:hypothetical protein